MKFNTEDINKAINKEIKKEIKKEYKKKEKKIIKDEISNKIIETTAIIIRNEGSKMKRFNALNVSSKFAICGLPIRVDTYKTCSFGCKYCFANCRKIMEFKKNLQIGDMKQVERKLDKIFNKKTFDEKNFLDNLISQKITWHCGGMSDPFQPIEKELGITKELVEISKKYNIHILFDHHY